MMISPPLLAAGFSDTITQISKQFGIDWPLLTAQILCFCIVAFLLWKFAFKPVLATLDERQKKIEAGLDYAEKMKAGLAATQARSEEIFREASLKARQIMADAQQTAKIFADAQQKEAVEKAGEILEKARQSLELEHKKMLADARGEIARLVVATTERVLDKRLTDEDRAAYNTTAARELTNV